MTDIALVTAIGGTTFIVGVVVGVLVTVKARAEIKFIDSDLEGILTGDKNDT